MALDTGVPRSRRALLAAAAGAAAATVVAAIDHPAPVQAGGDGDVVLGAANAATTTTTIANSTTEADVLVVESNAAANVIWGRNLGDGTGVAGTSESGHGIEGSSTGGMGVLGSTNTGTGVLGRADDTGLGVHGHGASTGSVGVYASTEAGTALQVSGIARLSRSGRVTVAAGRSYVDVDLRAKGGLAGTPLCFANLASHRPGTWIEAVRPNDPSTGRLRIYFNRAVTSSTFVVWLVLN